MLDGNIILSVAKAMELLQLLNQAAKPMPSPGALRRSGRSCRRMRLPASPWHDAQEKSCAPPRW